MTSAEAGRRKSKNYSEDYNYSEWEGLAPWEKAAQWHEVAPHIADSVMELAIKHAEHQWELERENACHHRLMETRLWVTQIVGLVLSFINVTVLAVVAWHYADTGNVIPGLAVFGAGTSLTAGAYITSRVIARKASQSGMDTYRGASDTRCRSVE